MKKIIAAAVALTLSASAQVSAAPIATSAYKLTALSGSFSFGQTNWNGFGQFGVIDNTTQLADVHAVLSDGYTPLGPWADTYNGIYSGYPDNANTIEFSFGGADYALDTLTFLSSRSYTWETSIVMQYALNGGAWQTAASTTAGALGIMDGDASAYTLNFGGITADAFRLSLNGNQISFHEISVDGQAIPAADVPEPAGMALLGLGLLGLAASRRQSKPKA